MSFSLPVFKRRDLCRVRVGRRRICRIVDDATWKAAQAVKSERRRDATPAQIAKTKRPKRIFSGPIKRGSCGGGMYSNGTDKKGTRLQCSAFRESGTCDNGRRVYLDVIETKAPDGLRHHLAHPEVITEFVDTYSAKRKRLKKEANRERSRIERRLGEIEREIRRAVDAITKEGVPAGR
jgi:site-specific DNA recombinase